MPLQRKVDKQDSLVGDDGEVKSGLVLNLPGGARFTIAKTGDSEQTEEQAPSRRNRKARKLTRAEREARKQAEEMRQAAIRAQSPPPVSLEELERQAHAEPLLGGDERPFRRLQ
jgi:hypothetical protein